MGQLTTVLLFMELLPKKNAKFRPKSQLMTKHRMFRATNLCLSREFYTNAVGDVGEIKKVWGGVGGGGEGGGRGERGWGRGGVLLSKTLYSYFRGLREWLMIW